MRRDVAVAIGLALALLLTIAAIAIGLYAAFPEDEYTAFRMIAAAVGGGLAARIPLYLLRRDRNRAARKK